MQCSSNLSSAHEGLHSQFSALPFTHTTRPPRACRSRLITTPWRSKGLQVPSPTCCRGVAPRRGRSAVAASIVMAGLAGTPGGSDLLIVGPGVLGSCAGKLWQERYPGSRVVGRTNTTANHERLAQLGITPESNEQADPSARFPNVLFCAPPSGSADYPAAVAAAASAWDGSGALVFTSSASAAATPDGGELTEDTPSVAVGAGPGTDKLLGAEEATLKAGGNVVRFVGLYHRNRGAHTFFLKMGQVPRWGQYVVNLIHYEDAARLAVAVLAGDGSSDGPYRRRMFLGCDNHPVTFQDMMDACSSSGLFEGSVAFTGDASSGGAGKHASNNATRAQLGWAPQYASFQEFVAAGGNDFYSQSALF